MKNIYYLSSYSKLLTSVVNTPLIILYCEAPIISCVASVEDSFSFAFTVPVELEYIFNESVVDGFVVLSFISPPRIVTVVLAPTYIPPP